MPVQPPVVAISGPTATGKSALALAIAERFGGTIINADSMQVYRELRILTARPGADALSRAPHRLYGFQPATQPCSVGMWFSLARSEIDAAHEAGRLPILVGGTGMYLRAAAEGLAEIPEIPSEVRSAARARLADEGSAALHAELARRDPETAARLRPGDSQRVVRAWEVLEATGRSLAAWQANHHVGSDLNLATVLVMPPREAVYAACDARFDAMAAAGAVDEAREFAALGLDSALPASRAVGLRPLLRLVAGELSQDAAFEAARRDTRRLARRQMTWFRHQMTPDFLTDTQFSERLSRKIFSFISAFLLTASG